MNETMKILVVDDESAIRASLKEILEEDGYTVVTAGNAQQAHEEIENNVTLALIDIKLGQDNGIILLKQIKSKFPQIPVIMISGHGTVALTSEAFKLGAHDFMEKPLRLVKVRASVRNALESVSLKHIVSVHERNAYPRPLFISQVMKLLYSQVERLSNIAAPVVIMGPSGSGKELVARALHYEGNRADGPFIPTNSASMPFNLAEDDLFGHEKGAFTGANHKRIGCIERAHGGTLFLDEIADMDLQIQAKLLRVLETGTFTRLGGSTPVQVNVRIISATHKDLDMLVKKGVFRQDLWYRLCAFVIKTPSLAERRSDIPLLAEEFLRKICEDMNLELNFDTAALNMLTQASFEGNVRELKHVITRAAVFSKKSTISDSDIAAILSEQRSTAHDHDTHINKYLKLDFKNAREQFEKDYLHQQLLQNHKNITATAAAIGMAQSNLSRKIKELGLR